MEYSAIKVKIGLAKNGYAKYPDFNALKCVKDSGIDWSYYIDKNGLGWHYDKTSGHRDETQDSPRGQQWGVIIADPTFCAEAVAAFPEDITAIDEATLETFYDEKAHAHEPEEKIDEKILTAIKTKQDLGLELTANQLSAIDPTTDTPGITKNYNKRWADFKARSGITIKK